MVFDKLKKTLKKLVDTVSIQIATKEIKEEDIDEFSDEIILELVEADVAYDAAQEIISMLKEKLVGRRIPRLSDAKKYILSVLQEVIEEILSKSWEQIDLISMAVRREPGNPLRLTFFGVNGVGKTTTIAKFAYMFKMHGITPVIVAADTFRAGAQEQLRKHSERLGAPFIGGSYGADPAAVAYDALEYARKRGYRVILIDTAGRMHTDTDLMNELRKIVRVVKPDYKILVIDSLTGNDAIDQAKFFEEAVGVDFIVLTKIDADVKGGTAISVAYAIGKPILYVGTGQSYGDLEPFNPKLFAAKIIGSLS
ncbi:MAG: signal recognition particle-docking protein FtsY [Pyrodictiaceae archaeon]